MDRVADELIERVSEIYLSRQNGYSSMHAAECCHPSDRPGVLPLSLRTDYRTPPVSRHISTVVYAYV